MQWLTASSLEKLTHRCDVTFPGFLRRFRLQSDPRLCWVSLRSKTYLTVLVPSLNCSIIDESKLKSVVIWFLNRLAAGKASEMRVWWMIAKLLVLWTPKSFKAFHHERHVSGPSWPVTWKHAKLGYARTERVTCRQRNTRNWLFRFFQCRVWIKFTGLRTWNSPLRSSLPKVDRTSNSTYISNLRRNSRHVHYIVSLNCNGNIMNETRESTDCVLQLRHCLKTSRVQVHLNIHDV